MTNLLNVTDQEWGRANHYFAHDPAAIKLDKPGKANGHSFIKVNNEIYAMANGVFLGEGAYSRVKIVQKQNGENYKVNIRPENNYNVQMELDILRELGQYKGEVTRHFDHAKQFWKKNPKKIVMTQEKTYKILELVEGKTLDDEINDRIKSKKAPLTKTQRIIIAIKTCQALRNLKAHRIIHRDIKPNNMVVNVNGNDITSTFIDYGLSKKLNVGETQYISGAGAGTKGYTAPEIVNGIYSHQSDIYALGKTFSYLRKKNDPLVLSMMSHNPQHRPSLKGVINSLVQELERRPAAKLDEHAMQVIHAHHQQFQERAQLKQAAEALQRQQAAEALQRQQAAEALQRQQEADFIAQQHKALQPFKKPAAAPKHTKHWLAKAMDEKMEQVLPPTPPPPPPPIAEKKPVNKAPALPKPAVVKVPAPRHKLPVAKTANASLIAKSSAYLYNCAMHSVIHSWLNLPAAQIRELADNRPFFDILFRQLYSYYELPGEYNRETIFALNQHFDHPRDREILWGQVFRKTLKMILETEGKNEDAHSLQNLRFISDHLVAKLTKMMGATLTIEIPEGNQMAGYNITYLPYGESTWNASLLFVNGDHYDFTFNNAAKNAAHNHDYAQNRLAKLYGASHIDGSFLDRKARRKQQDAIQEIVVNTYFNIEGIMAPIMPIELPRYTPLADVELVVPKVDTIKKSALPKPIEPRKKIHWMAHLGYNL